MQVIPFFDKPCIVGAPAAELARPCKRQRGQYVNARVGRSTSGPVCGDCDSHSSALGVEIPVSEDFCVVLALLYCLVILGLLDLARLAADAIKADMAGAQKWKDMDAGRGVNNALRGLLTTRHTEIKVEKLSKHFVSRKGLRIYDVVHGWMLDEKRTGVYICFTTFHAIAVDTDAKKIYDPCFPTPKPLSDICTYSLTEKCWRLSCA